MTMSTIPAPSPKSSRDWPRLAPLHQQDSLVPARTVFRLGGVRRALPDDFRAKGGPGPHAATGGMFAWSTGMPRCSTDGFSGWVR